MVFLVTYAASCGKEAMRVYVYICMYMYVYICICISVPGQFELRGMYNEPVHKF
jgi:hypothetical protein